MIVREVPWEHPDSVALREAQRLDIAERYGADDSEPGPAPTADDITVFFVAYNDDDDEAVGCGGLRQLDAQHGEVKRMFVRQQSRGSGAATAVLTRLEESGRERGWNRLVLETGDQQPEAIRLYEREGYHRIPNFGYYADSPISLCYEKELRPNLFSGGYEAPFDGPLPQTAGHLHAPPTSLASMTTSLAELLAQVPALNDPAQPFTYTVKGNTIVGAWDIVRAKSLYPKEFKSIDKKYSITVEFDEKKSTYKYKDREKSSGFSAGTGGISFGSSGFSGKESKKEFSFELGGVNKTDAGISPVLAWSFDTSKIKTPLFDFLEKNGWAHKKGLFG